MLNKNNKEIEGWERKAAEIALDAHKLSKHYSQFSECIYQGIKELIHQELQKAREEERDRILSNILKWSTTATVMETTGKEGAKRATTKLRSSLAGCYHFLYQALRINQTELNQPNK